MNTTQGKNQDEQFELSLINLKDENIKIKEGLVEKIKRKLIIFQLKDEQNTLK